MLNQREIFKREIEVIEEITNTNGRGIKHESYWSYWWDELGILC